MPEDQWGTWKVEAEDPEFKFILNYTASPTIPQATGGQVNKETNDTKTTVSYCSIWYKIVITFTYSTFRAFIIEFLPHFELSFDFLQCYSK